MPTRLALRTAAERVDKDVIDYLKTHAVSELWSPHDRLLVCVDESGNSDSLVRTAARMASRAKVQWIALYVESSADAVMTEKEKTNITEALSLAEKLGTEAATIRGGANIADDIRAGGHQEIPGIVGDSNPRPFCSRRCARKGHGTRQWRERLRYKAVRHSRIVGAPVRIDTHLQA